MSDIQHGKVITVTTYYEGEVSSTREEREVSIYTDRDRILKDIIDAMSVISDGTSHKLDLCIQVDRQDRYRLIKKWGE